MQRAIGGGGKLSKEKTKQLMEWCGASTEVQVAQAPVLFATEEAEKGTGEQLKTVGGKRGACYSV